jgi:serine protease Do
MPGKLILGLGLLYSLSLPQSESVSEKLSRLEDRYRETLVQVRYTQQVMVSNGEPPQEEKLTTTGILVSADGMVMVSGMIYEPFNQVPHGVGIRFPATVTRAEAKVREARIHLVDGSEYSATLLGRDREADVAFFRIEAEDRRFEPVVFDDAPMASLGQQVVVLSLLPEPLGPALAVELTRVQAIVSNPSEGFVVATGAADPVGSLVCDLEGTPLGMLDALTVSMPGGSMRNPLSFLSVLRGLPKGVGRGFARPAKQFAAAATRPPETAPMRRGWLGVEMQALTPELARHQGFPVRAGIILGYVYRGSPAERAGLATGDVLIELQGRPIEVGRDEDLGAFSEKLLRAGVGTEVAIGYLRDGEKRTTVATLAAAPKMAREAETVEVDELDLAVREVTFDYLATRNLEPDTEGVVVKQPPVAVRTSPHRVQRGDLLVKIGEQKVADIASFRRAVETLRQDKPGEVVLFVERGKESFFFAVKPDWE